ncbi:MAG: PspC domain-containing protein [Chloroflexota bacterium]|nr:MAG: hypothetical protein DIU80_01915 [Chloroflexota bacterium]
METKRIYRSQSDRMVAGVASGLAAYLGVDPILVRLGFLLLTLINGLGALLYLALWLLVPAEGSLTTDSRAQVRENATEIRDAAERLAQRIRGLFAS